MAKKERQSNIELLRIIGIAGIIILHYNNPVIGGGITYVQKGSLNFYILYALESFFACGVDLFILISGYFLCESKSRSWWKPIELIVQVMLFREGIYLIRVLTGHMSFSVKSLFTMLIPANYFVILYCAVYLISPFLNLLIDHLSIRRFRVFMMLTFGLFAVYPTFVDVISELRGESFVGLSTVGMYGSQWGYTIVNFILMYLLGAYLRKGRTKLMNVGKSILIACILISVLILMIWAIFNDWTGFFTERSAWEYCNPVLILESVLLFALFSNFEIGVNKFINKLAEACFSVFLLHNIFISFLRIEQFVTGNVFVMLAHILISTVLIYLICCVVHFLYHFITDPVFSFFTERIKLPPLTAEEI